MGDKNFSFAIDEKALEKLQKKADSEERTIAGQLRYLIDAYVENRMEIKES